jgi:Ca2+-binding RTX toxin-like protein
MVTFQGTGRADGYGGTGKDDVIRGEGGRDVLGGGDGRDTMFGGGGNDVMAGGNGDDVMVGSNGRTKQTNLNAFDIVESVTGKVTFEGESAGFKNTLGMYKIAADGTMTDVKIIFANASLEGSGGKLLAGVSTKDFELSAGERIGFFIVPNAFDQKGMDKLLCDPKATWKLVDMDAEKAGMGNKVLGNVNNYHTKLVHVSSDGVETDIKSNYGREVFHSTNKSGWLNADGYDHVKGHSDVLEGKVRIGFEDLWNGGDKDFDDCVFTLDIGVKNASSIGGGLGKSAKGPDHDQMDGGVGNDVMYGVSGNDTMDGGDGNDKLSGGSGDDVMNGGAGDDLVMGNSGDDRIYASAGNDRLIGGSGFDTLDFSKWDGGAVVNMNQKWAKGDGTAAIEGFEAVVGSAFADQIDGDKRANVIDGSAGDDVLRGRGGEDVLTGGEGRDTFRFLAKDVVDGEGRHLGLDRITDFGKEDVLDLRGLFKKGTDADADLDNHVVVKSDGQSSWVIANIHGNWTEVAILENFSGASAHDMLKSGMLLA